MPKRHLLSLLVPLVTAALLALSVHAQAQTRVALVIGNSAYQKVVNLANPAHDAQDVSESLERLGFTVKTVIDADFDGFRRALLEFGRMAPNADMAVFYFAGHGVEINGNNWLLPTDVELKNQVDAGTEAISLRSAMQAVAAAKTLGLVILDACRNNPFQSSLRAGATRSVQMLGLAPVEPTENVLVAYAARDGTVAADGSGRNSPYTTALLKHIEAPGLEVDFLFRNIRDDVMAATNNEQQPFVYGSLSSDEIYFKASPAAPAAADAAPPPDAAEIAWSFLRATHDVSTLSRFVDSFPESAHVSEAKVRIASLAAPPAPTTTDVAVLPLVPRVTFVDTEFEQAEKAVARRFVRDTPAVEQAWDVIKETKDHTVIRHFVERFPSKTRRVAADTHLAALGQKPITVSVAPPQPFDVNEAVFAQAAADPDVRQCFELGDQTAIECQRAFQRFPNIGHFAEDIRFTLTFCQAMGNPGGCVPTVKTTWNFPTSKPSGGGTIGVSVTTPPAPPSPSPVPPPPCLVCSPGPGKKPPVNADLIKNKNANNNGNHNNSGGVKDSKSSHHGHMGGGSNASNTRTKTTSLKVTGPATAGVKAATVTTPVPNTSNVRVNPNVKVNANVKFIMRVPTPTVRLPLR